MQQLSGQDAMFLHANSMACHSILAESASTTSPVRPAGRFFKQIRHAGKSPAPVADFFAASWPLCPMAWAGPTGWKTRISDLEYHGATSPCPSPVTGASCASLPPALHSTPCGGQTDVGNIRDRGPRQYRGIRAAASPC